MTDPAVRPTIAAQSQPRDFESLRAIILECAYPGFEWIVDWNDGEPWFQVSSPEGVDTRTGEPLPWKGRKWKLSVHMTDTEIVHTVWAAVQRALLHEACELFQFKSMPIFDRHINVHMLHDLRANEPGVLDGRIDL